MRRGPLRPRFGNLADQAELREQFEQQWSAQDRAWMQDRDTCCCAEPSPGPAYFKQRWCTRCQHEIRE